MVVLVLLLVVVVVALLLLLVEVVLLLLLVVVVVMVDVRDVFFSIVCPRRQANAARALALDRQRAEEKRKEQKDCVL